MEHRQLGQSEIRFSAITFGAWAIGGWMWGGADERDAIAALHKAVETGMTSIDTAAIYGQGHSESIVGQALQGRRHEVQILTKFGLRWDTDKGQHYFDSTDNQGRPISIHRYAGKASVIEECEQSLKRLRTDYIDLYQHHRPDPTTPIEETMEALSLLLEQGKIRTAGVSNYTLEETRQALDALPIVSNQVPYSMLEREIETELVPFCREQRMSILAYSPLQRGILTGKIRPGHSFAPTDHRSDQYYFEPENHQRVMGFLAEIRPIADDRQVTLAQLVLNWTLHRPGITHVLAGARNPQQVEENAGAADFRLSPNETEQIDTALGRLVLER
jgi:aryl-alcohol dehydrogenase-like predicted oxidoreductase